MTLNPVEHVLPLGSAFRSDVQEGVPLRQKREGLLLYRSCPLLADWVSEDMMDAKRL